MKRTSSINSLFDRSPEGKRKIVLFNNICEGERLLKLYRQSYANREEYTQVLRSLYQMYGCWETLHNL